MSVGTRAVRARGSGSIRIPSRTNVSSIGTRWPALAPLLAAEAFSAAVGFGVMIHLARRLGASGFADLEYASAVAAWWLVVVRGGFDAIAYREAARRPGLVRPLTDLLLGLRLASTAVGLLAVLALAWLAGPERGRVVVAAGLVLIPSALAADVGLRGSSRFGPLALAQLVRSLGLAFGAAWLVSGIGHAAVSAGCVAAAEAGSTLVLLGFYAADHGLPRPRFRRRAWSALARRGAVAGLTRFGRVTLYAADMIALGWMAGPALGPYAAARRLAFALMALGLVVPTALGPRLAVAWASGAGEARSMLARAMSGLLAAALPATVGLMATADRWMPHLFGEGFREGGPWLALIAARLPLVLISNLQQAALVAARREGQALRLIAGMVALAAALVPSTAVFGGPWAVGLAMLAIEAAGLVGGALALRRLDLGCGLEWSLIPIAAGCAAVALIGRVGRGWPLGAVVVASVAVYAAIWRGGSTIGRGPVAGRAAA